MIDVALMVELIDYRWMITPLHKCSQKQFSILWKLYGKSFSYMNLYDEHFTYFGLEWLLFFIDYLQLFIFGVLQEKPNDLISKNLTDKVHLETSTQKKFLHKNKFFLYMSTPTAQEERIAT